MLLRAIVIDDERLAREYIKEYISKHPNLEFSGDYNSPLKAVNQIESGEVDLIFLDIQMPEISGLDFIKTLKVKPHIIITTAYKEFAYEGFELEVCDYLLKPFSFERFDNAVKRCLQLSKKENPIVAEELNTNIGSCLTIRANRKFYRVNYENILYVVGMGAYVKFYLPDKNITALSSLQNLENDLPKNLFLRVHKSYIVSIKNIESYNGNEIEIAGIKIPVSKTYKEDVERLFGI